MAYTTLEKVKQDLGTTSTEYDTLLTDYISYASSLIDNYLGFSLQAQDYVEKYIIQMSEYPDVIVLKRTPVNSINYVKVDGEDLTSNDYEVRLDQGIVVLKQYSFGAEVEISYNAGYNVNEIPAEIEFITRKITTALFQRRDGLTIQSERAGGVSITYASDAVENEINRLLNSFSNVLDVYKHVAV